MIYAEIPSAFPPSVIALCKDSFRVRGVENALQSRNGARWRGTASDLVSFGHLLRLVRPNVAIIMGCEERATLFAGLKLARNVPSPPGVVLIHDSWAAHEIDAALVAGALGCVQTSQAAASILTAVLLVARGDRSIPDDRAQASEVAAPTRGSLFAPSR